MAQGFRNREIAAAFVISESTVKVHVRHILEKLNVQTRAQAVTQFRAPSYAEMASTTASASGADCGAERGVPRC